jgi:hypothetical protein
VTRSNRTLNRIVLAVLGVIAIAVGLAAGYAAYARYGATADSAGWSVPVVDDAVATLRSVRLDDGTLWTIVAVCAAVVVLALAWAASRGRGGSSVGVREEYDTGRVTVNVALLRDVVDAELADVRDVVRTRVDTYRVRGGRAARLRIVLRRGGDAVDVLAASDRAVETLDTVLGRRIPLLVHIVGG